MAKKGYEIIDEAWPRGVAKRIALITGKSEDLYNSYRRAPRSRENPFGTGNYNPVDPYLEFFHLVLGADREAAIRMHRLLCAEIEQTISEFVGGGENVQMLSLEIMERAVQCAKAMSGERVKEMRLSELQRAHAQLVSLDAAVEYARAVLRSELRRYDPLPLTEARV